jgi:hypothetical protein
MLMVKDGTLTEGAEGNIWNKEEGSKRTLG